MDLDCPVHALSQARRRGQWDASTLQHDPLSIFDNEVRPVLGPASWSRDSPSSKMQNHLFSLKESPSIASSASPLSAHDPSQQSHSATSFPPHTRPGLTIQDPATMSSYYPSHELGSASPHDGYSHLGEALRAGGGGSGTPSPAQISAMMMHNPKRAYRQRRKDPSCDACRERKVKVGLSGMHERRQVTNVLQKCDATETSSCTECSSRNVRCQFTKDTNRRMSSIK